MIQRRIKASPILLFLVLTNGMGQAGSPQAPAPNGQISGCIVDADTGKPLAGVNVTLGPSPRAKDVSTLVKAAADGTYEFGGLVPGDYAVTAYQTGFARAVYGADLRSGGWTPVTLRSGQGRTNIDLRLHPYAKVTQMDLAASPSPLPSGYYTFSPGLFSPDGKQIAFTVGDTTFEKAWLYDRVSHQFMSPVGWEIPGDGSASDSARTDRFIVRAENRGHGSFSLLMQTVDGERTYQIASGFWELERFVYEPDRSLILYLDHFDDWEWGDSHDGAIVTFDLNRQRSQETYLPTSPEKLIAAVPQGDGYLVAYSTSGPCDPEVLAGGRRPPQLDARQNVCFAKVPVRGH